MLAFDLIIPTPRKIRPPIVCSMNPKTCSIRLRTFDFCRLLSFCSSVKGWPLLPFYPSCTDKHRISEVCLARNWSQTILKNLLQLPRLFFPTLQQYGAPMKKETVIIFITSFLIIFGILQNLLLLHLSKYDSDENILGV